MFTLGPGLRSGVVPDPSFGQVQLLLHGDGADNSTTFTDSSSFARTITGFSGAKLATEQSVFGGACLDFTDASNGARIVTPSAAGLSMSGDFCLEFRLRMTSTALNIYFLHGDGATSDIYVYTGSAGKLSFSVCNNLRVDKCSVSVDTWYALCIDRSGLNTKLFLDGAQIDTYTEASAQTMGASATWYIGSNPGLGGGSGGRCFIDELRLTSSSRHQAAYTVDSEAFPDV